MLNLLKVKSIPILMYALESCSLHKHQISSLDFTVVRLGMKLLCSSNRNLVVSKLAQCGFELPSSIWERRSKEFSIKFNLSENVLCRAMLNKGSVVFA